MVNVDVAGVVEPYASPHLGGCKDLTVRRTKSQAEVTSLAPEQALQAPPLPHTFYARDVVTVSRELIGKVLVHDAPAGLTAGRIVETEAYEQSEAACHAYQKRTARNEVMYGPPGFAYIYFSYGVHWMLNLVTGPRDFAAAVLIRALEPLVGLDLMRERRAGVPRLELARGPGKLAQAIGIDASLYGADLTQGPLTVRDTPTLAPIVASARIGITKAVDLPWRFFVESAYVSRGKTAPVP